MTILCKIVAQATFFGKSEISCLDMSAMDHNNNFAQNLGPCNDNFEQNLRSIGKKCLERVKISVWTYLQ